MKKDRAESYFNVSPIDLMVAKGEMVVDLEISPQLNYFLNLRRDRISRATSFDPMYVDIVGDLVAGILLSCIVDLYFGSGEEFVSMGGYEWIRKGYKDWYTLCSISRSSAIRGIKFLKSKKILFTMVTGEENRYPVNHVRINWDVLFEMVMNYIENDTVLDTESKHLYFVKAYKENECYHKIGVTKYPKRRTVDLLSNAKKTGFSFETVYITRNKTARHKEFENEILERYQDKNTHGEWFVLDGDDEGNILKRLKEIDRGAQ